MNYENIKLITENINFFYPNFFNLKTEYFFCVINKKEKIETIKNIFLPQMPEELIILRLVYDISLIKQNINFFAKQLSEDIDDYNFDKNTVLSLVFNVCNGQVTVDDNSATNNTNIAKCLAYNNFIKCLKNYLTNMSLNAKYSYLIRAIDFIDMIDDNGISNFYKFISINMDLYSKFTQNVISKNEYVNSQKISGANQNYVNTNNYPGMNGYNAAQNYYPKTSNDMCVASFVFAMISIFFWWLIIPPILAFAFGVSGIRHFDNKKEKNKTLGYIGFGFGSFYLFLVVFLIVLPFLFNALSS